MSPHVSAQAPSNRVAKLLIGGFSEVPANTSASNDELWEGEEEEVVPEEDENEEGGFTFGFWGPDDVGVGGSSSGNVICGDEVDKAENPEDCIAEQDHEE